MGPFWPLVAPWPLLMSLSFILLPLAGQMFACNAADKEKAFHSHSHTQRERQLSFALFLDVLSMIGYMGLRGAVVSAFDGQGDSSCGFAWCTVVIISKNHRGFKIAVGNKNANKGFILPELLFSTRCPKMSFCLIHGWVLLADSAWLVSL